MRTMRRTTARRTTARRTATVVGLSAVLAGGSALSASAITGGEPDGELHRNVGLIAFYESGSRYRCTASLVTPTVLLTAGHCTMGTAGKTIVTFASVLAEQPPSPLPKAADPAKGYTDADLAGTSYPSGTAHTHPQYSDFTDMKNWNDVGVVVLDKPITNISPVKLAPRGYLDQFTPNTLNKQLFEIVGYGTEVRKPDTGKQKPEPMSFPLLRRYAFAPGQKLTPQILQVNGNPNDNKGTGGSCFGDSGGPTFHSPTNSHSDGEVQVTVTSYGYTQNCRYLDGLQRVDIPVVQDWLATYGVTPSAG